MSYFVGLKSDFHQNINKNGSYKTHLLDLRVRNILTDHSDHFTTPEMVKFGSQGAKNGSKRGLNATLGSKWPLVHKNGWKKVE